MITIEVNEANFLAYKTRMIEVMAFLKSADKMVKHLDRIMDDALVEVKLGMPHRTLEDAYRTTGLASKWKVEKPDQYTWILRHEYSSASHPLHVILASLEYGSMPHPIVPEEGKFLAWYDPELAARLRTEYGEKAWASADDIVFFPAPHPDEAPRFGGVMHPGNRPYMMLTAAADTVETRVNLWVVNLAQQIKAIAKGRAA